MNACKERAHDALLKAGKEPANYRPILMTANAPAGAPLDYEIMATLPDDEPRIIARRLKSACCKHCALTAYAAALHTQPENQE